MSERRETLAAAVAVEIRTPLARVELAASQLEREAWSPTSERLARSIRGAVGEIDARISGMLRLLLPPAPRTPCQPLGPALASLQDRLAPSLAARGVTLRHAPPGERLTGDSQLVRRAAVSLIRAASALARSGGEIVVDLCVESERIGVRASWTGDGGGREAAEDALGSARAFALAQGGLLEATGEPEATLWLPRGESPCVAS